MDQDATWYGGTPQPDHIVLDGYRALQNGHSPLNFRPICCGQTAGWIKMPLGKAVGRKWVAAVSLFGELGLCLIQRGLGRGLSSYKVAS